MNTLQLHCHGSTLTTRRPQPAGPIHNSQRLLRPPTPAPCNTQPTNAPWGRSYVIAQAKRGRKTSKKADDAEEPEEATPSGWDAALAGVDAEIEPAAGSGASSGAPAEELTRGAEGAQEEASRLDQPEAIYVEGQGEPSTSYGGAEADAAPKSRKKKKRPPTVMGLAEYQALMEAKARKEAEEAARLRAGQVEEIPVDARLDLNRQSFAAYEFDGGVEFLVSEDMEGRLALHDSYVLGKGDRYYTRPTFQGHKPEEPFYYQVVPWMEQQDEDVLKHKPLVQRLKRLYFIGLEPEGPGTAAIALQRCFSFEGASRTLRHEPVRVVTADGSDDGVVVEPILRIRPQGISIEEASLIPTPFQVSDGLSDLPEDADGEASESEAADMPLLLGPPEGPASAPGPELPNEDMEERMAELEREGAMDELDEMPDVPSVDMM